MAEGEAGEALAAEDDPAQRRRQLLGRFDPAGEERSVLGAGSVWGGGDGEVLGSAVLGVPK
jgi:hypothetical protein